MTSEPIEEHVEEREDQADPGWPAGFITVLVLAALYLIWRFIQLGVRFFEWVM